MAKSQPKIDDIKDLKKVTDTSDGLMSKEDKAKLDNLSYEDLGDMPEATNTEVGGIKIGFIQGLDADLLDGKHASGFATAAQGEKAYTAIQGVKRNGTLLTPSSNIVDVNVPTKVSDLTNDSGFLISITKAMVEAVLTGTVTSHGHNYTTSTDVQTLINTAIASVYKPKGNIANKTALLALTNIKQGDVYNAQSAFTLSGQNVKIGDNIVCLSDAATSLETNWDNLGGNIDFAAALSQALIGFSATSGNITSSDTILSAINKLAYDKHIHSNLNVLDLTTAAFTTALKNNYDFAYAHSQTPHAPTDAEANVQSDWFEINDSYDSFIKNKPHILRYIGKLESSSDIDLRLKEEGIYTLCMGTKYLFAPNLYCGTDEYSTQLSGHLTICKPDGHGATMTYHDFRQNIVYVASAVNGVGNVLLWNDWKRLLTCRDEIIEDLEETEEFSYEIGSSYQLISLNGNDIKGEKILIDLKNFNSQIGAKLRIVISINPACPNPDIQIIDSSGAKPISYSLSYYTAPSSVNFNVFLIEYEIFNLSPYWLVSNKIYY